MFRKWIPILCVVALLAAPAAATTLAQMSLSQLTQAARVIVRARFLGGASNWQRGEIWTASRFRVLETFKGRTAAEITVRTIGGRVGGVESLVDGVPHFVHGEEVVLFLDPLPQGGYAITAWTEGTFRVRTVRGRPYLTQATAAQLVYNPATKKFHTAGVQRMPLAEFRRRMRQLTGEKPRLESDSAAKTGASGGRR